MPSESIPLWTKDLKLDEPRTIASIVDQQLDIHGFRDPHLAIDSSRNRAEVRESHENGKLYFTVESKPSPNGGTGFEFHVDIYCRPHED